MWECTYMFLINNICYLNGGNSTFCLLYTFYGFATAIQRTSFISKTWTIIHFISTMFSCYSLWYDMTWHIIWYIMCHIYIPWESKTKQRMVFRMIHVKDSLLPMGKVWSLDFLGICISRVSNTFPRLPWPFTVNTCCLSIHPQLYIDHWICQNFNSRCFLFLEVPGNSI